MDFESLNPEQLKAVRHGIGPSMVVAGAGSGKTRVITCRIAHLIREQGVDPESVLAITFTNKAAGEMKERIRNMLGQGELSPWVSTFHSFCLRMLRKHIAELGFSNDFAVYDAQDQLTLVKQCMKAAQISTDAFPAKSLLNHISGFKNDFIVPEQLDLDSMSYGNQMKAGELYPFYQAALKSNNALDFDDLLAFTAKLFQQSSALREYYDKKFQYILVDEFQDTNAVQYELVRLLSRDINNVCVVGDDDQSIYRWRGANIENILKFEKDYPGTTVIKLEENYRSTQNILKAAGNIVGENLNRNEKTLWTKNEKGDPVVCHKAEDETNEAAFVCDRIQNLCREEGYSFNEIAILYRTNAQSRVMEDVLRRAEIPYQIIGGLRFYERKEIKDVLAYMRVLVNSCDSISLKRIVNVPARGIGKTSLEKIDSICGERGIPLFEGLRLAGKGGLIGAAATKKIANFISIMDHLDSVYRQSNALELLTEVIERSGYAAMLNNEDTRESKGRMENLNELYSAVEQLVENENSSLQEFLDSTALVADIDNLDDTRGILPLMTLHTCKGLEFSAVFVVGMENGLLPHASSMSDSAEYEEERRLCYVGFTRAKKRLFISYARRRRIYGSNFNYPPSEFINSIPEEVLVRESGEYKGETSESFLGSTNLSFSVEEESTKNYPIGTKVLHPKFGSGIVINRSGEEEDLKLEVFFKGPHGKKKLAANLANLIIL